MKRRGIPIVISAASGTGKTSLCKRLLETLSHTARSISYTTRPPRGEEVHGRDYFFVDGATFDQMVADGEFIEWAEVFGRRYGTSFSAVQDQLDQGVDVLLDIDVQGGMQVRERLEHALLIFLLPPSMDELKRRLINRAEDAPDVIARRLQEAKNEIRASKDYDYLVVNDDFDQAATDLRAIVRTHRLRRNRRDDLVAALTTDD
ncbi:MAG: guanylate kinase [Deltaproteobacteria bacterium]|nr:guanylate kinase [Deltaproteobacteria bacterium]